MVQDILTVSIKFELEVVCALLDDYFKNNFCMVFTIITCYAGQ